MGFNVMCRPAAGRPGGMSCAAAGPAGVRPSQGLEMGVGSCAAGNTPEMRAGKGAGGCAAVCHGAGPGVMVTRPTQYQHVHVYHDLGAHNRSTSMYRRIMIEGPTVGVAACTGVS